MRTTRRAFVYDGAGDRSEHLDARRRVGPEGTPRAERAFVEDPVRTRARGTRAEYAGPMRTTVDVEDQPSCERRAARGKVGHAEDRVGTRGQGRIEVQFGQLRPGIDRRRRSDGRVAHPETRSGRDGRELLPSPEQGVEINTPRATRLEFDDDGLTLGQNRRILRVHQDARVVDRGAEARHEGNDADREVQQTARVDPRPTETSARRAVILVLSVGQAELDIPREGEAAAACR